MDFPLFAVVFPPPTVYYFWICNAAQLCCRKINNRNYHHENNHSNFVIFIPYLLALCPGAWVLNYRAVARNNAGVALVNQTIKVRMTLLRNNVFYILKQDRSPPIYWACLIYKLAVQVHWLLPVTSQRLVGYPIRPMPLCWKWKLIWTTPMYLRIWAHTAFNTVPFAFGAKTAIDVVNLAGRYIDPVTAPAINSRLVWNGYAWTPTKKDSTINLTGSISPIAAGGPSALGYG